MIAMKPLDLLIITPLEDEEWACQRWFKGATVASGENLRWMLHSSGLSIGLFSFHGMGSVVAAIKTAPLLQTYRPKNVLLLGIAAGQKFRGYSTHQGKGFNLGDVAYNNSIYYCSYGKIVGADSPRIRAVPPLGPDEVLAGFVRDVGRGEEWKKIAKSWHDLGKDEWQRSFNFPPQEWPQNDLRALSADVGSGELVVASEKYQATVRVQFPAADITVFEMEAYAVGKVCRDLGVPFLTIRGISDFGRVTKDDKYRLAAALAPSALVKALLDNQGFVERILKGGFPLTNSHTPCLLPLTKTPTPCPYEQTQDRKCVDLGITVHAAQPALLTRALEHVEPFDYSRSLNDRLGQLSRKEERVVFFFPYSAEETVRWCAQKAKEQLISEFGELRHESLQGNNDQPRIVKVIREIAEAGRKLYPHFKACEGVCKDLMDNHQVTKAELPMFMSRVIITSQVLDRFECEIENLIYLFLLGTETVPTFLMSDRLTRTKVRDDITFFESLEPKDDDGAFNWLKAVRFFPNSWLLLITGWPCGASGKKIGGEKKLVHISGLYSEWKKKISELDMNDRDFCEFPHAALWQRYVDSESAGCSTKSTDGGDARIRD